jgi:hypothetical protein
MSGAKRRQKLKRQGYDDFCPDFVIDIPFVNNKPLEGYDRECYAEGWDKAYSEYSSQLQRESELAQESNQHDR